MDRDEFLERLKKGDLGDANLIGADLRDADLQGADLRGVDLEDASLIGADLRRADLRRADLTFADLRRADLRGADLRGANLDFCCWPLSCYSLRVKIDENQARQLAYHLCAILPEELHAGATWLFDLANEWPGIENHELEKLMSSEEKETE